MSGRGLRSRLPRGAVLWPLLLAHAIAPGVFVAPAYGQASASTACPKPADVTHQHLYGAWRAEFTPEGAATLRLQKHPEFAQSVSGEIVRGAVRAQVAGDVEDGAFHLEESSDGTSIAAVWAGQVVEGSCGKEIKGTWKHHKDGTERTFTLRKTPGWQ
jgi:hypothetical protein